MTTLDSSQLVSIEHWNYLVSRIGDASKIIYTDNDLLDDDACIHNILSAAAEKHELRARSGEKSGIYFTAAKMVEDGEAADESEACSFLVCLS